MVKTVLIFAVLSIGSPVFACSLSISASLPNGTIGVPYSGSISAIADCPGSFVYTFSGIPGLSVNPSTGVVSGSPTGGASIATVGATETTFGQNPQQLSASSSYVVVISIQIVQPPPTSPATCTIQISTSPTLPAGVVNQFYFQQILATTPFC